MAIALFPAILRPAFTGAFTQRHVFENHTRQAIRRQFSDDQSSVLARCRLEQQMINQETRDYSRMMANPGPDLVTRGIRRVSSFFSNLIGGPIAMVAQSLFPSQNNLVHTDEDVVIIPGSTGCLGKQLTLRAIQEGKTVVALTRNAVKAREIFGDHPNLMIFEISEAASQDEAGVKDAFSQLFQGRHFNSISIINTIGGTTPHIGPPDSEQVLSHINIDRPMALLEGILEASEGHANRQSLVNFSSYAVSIVNEKGSNCVYTRVRRTAEQAISQLGIQFGATVTHLRIGIVLNPFLFDEKTNQWVLDNGYSFSPENWAKSPFCVLLGSGNQIIQPVVSTDLCAAALNATHRDFGPEVMAIDAVGSDRIAQDAFMTYFRNDDQTTVLIHVPENVGRSLAGLLASGRFQPYGANIIATLDQPDAEILDGTNFERLLGHTPTTMDDLYLRNEVTEFSHPGSPVGDYLKQIPQAILQNPKQALRCLNEVLRSLAMLEFGVVVLTPPRSVEEEAQRRIEMIEAY